LSRDRTAISGNGWIASAFFWSGAPSWRKNIKFGIGCFDLLSVPSHDGHRGAKPYLGEAKKAATDETIEPAAKLRSRTGKNASAEQANDAHNHPNHTDKRSHRSPKNLSILDLPRSLLLRRPRLRRGGGRQSFGASRRCRQPSRYERCCEDEAPMMKHCDARGILAILPGFYRPAAVLGGRRVILKVL
jgi:hypothetical protein